MQRLTITIDDDLVAEVDDFIAKHGYANRSEAFRDLLRSGLEHAGGDTAGNRHCMVCLHHHPVAMDSRWLDRVGLENAEEFFQTLDRHRNVRALVWGHVHQAYEGLRKGVRMLATPSTCAQFLPHAADFMIDRQPPAYRTLELRADGSLTTEVVWVDKRTAESLDHSGRRSVSSAA